MYVRIVRSWWAFVIALVIVLSVVAGAAVVAYNTAIERATTAEGWIDENTEGDAVFVLDVDGNLYEWFVEE